MAETKTLKAKIDGSYVVDEIEIIFKSGEPDYFTIDHDGNAVAGVGDNVTIEIFDLFNNTVNDFSGIIRVYTDSPEPADMITWGIGSGAGSIISEDRDTLSYQYSVADNGVVTLVMTDNRAETIRFTTEYGSVISESDEQLNVIHGAADEIFVISGDNQRSVVNNPVPAPLVVGVEDQWGNRVQGETVTFIVISGLGEIDTDISTGGLQSTSVTGSLGTATCDRWILGTASGYDSDEAAASISSGSVTTAYFSATTDHDQLSSVVLTPLSSGVTVNSSTIVTATLKDQYDNLVTDENITIYIKDTPDGGLSADLSNPNATDELGPVIRSGKTDSTGTITVVYNAPAAAGRSDLLDANNAVISAENIDDVIYTTVASGATKLIVTDISDPTVEAGESFSFIIRAVDSNNNLDPSNSSHVVFSPEAGGSLIFSLSDFGSEITEADLVNGSVTIFGRGSHKGTWQTDITASAPVLTATDFDIAIIANHNVDHYLFSAPSNAVAGNDFAIQLQAKDIYGNLVTSASYDIDLRAVQPIDTTADAGGSLSVISGSIINGLYYENNISYQVAEQIRIEVTDDSTSVAGVTDPITIGHAPAYQIVELGGDSTGVAAGDSVTLRAEVFDRYGNNVVGESVSFSILGGSGSLAATQRFTRSDGTTSVRYRTGTIAGVNTVRAAVLDGTPEGLETQVFEITTVPASAISYVILDVIGTSFTAGIPFACEAAAYDQYDNLIISDNSTRIIPVAESPSIDFIPDTLTLSAGEVVFAAIDTAMGSNRIALESLSGTTLAPFGSSFTVTHGDAYIITEISGDTTGVISGDTTEVSIRVGDTWGNPVNEEIVHFSLISDLGGVPSLDDDTGSAHDGLVITNPDGTARCRVITDQNAGENIVSATILDGEPASREKVEFSIVTIAGNISRYVLSTVEDSYLAGEHFNVEIVAYDLNDNIAYGDFTTVVQLGSNATAVWDDNPVTLSNGSVITGVTETLAGNLQLTAETDGGGALSSSEVIEILPELPAGIIGIASVIPDTITANGRSRSSITTSQIRDLYGNIVSQRTRITVAPSLGAVASDDIDPAEPGVQRETTVNGIISAFVESSVLPGNSLIGFESVEGNATGSATVVFAPPPVITFGGYISPVNIVPGEDISFRILVNNTSVTGLYIDAGSSVSIPDGSGNTFYAELGSPVFMEGSSTDTLFFDTSMLPSGFAGGRFTPRISIDGTDIYGAQYSADFNAGTNSVIVSSIEISQITAQKTVLSRGDTASVNIYVRNNGGDLVIIEDIQLDFSNGYYSVISPTSSLNDTILAGLEKNIPLDVRVLPNSPLGADTIDARVHASSGGNDFYDYSAGDGRFVWLIQSAATIAYQGGSLMPSKVSRGQTQQYSLDLGNSGEAPVILDADNTIFSFTDGLIVFSSQLTDESALPGVSVTNLEFIPGTIPLAMAPGRYPVTLSLIGTENGAPFDTVFTLSDSVDVTEPAQVGYIASSIIPITVSKNSYVSFEAGLRNTGGSSVIADPYNSYIAFNDGVTTYYALLDRDRGFNIDTGDNTLYFKSIIVSEAMITGSYTPLIHVEGTENGIPFSDNIIVTDQVSVQEPSQLSINSIVILPTDRITADQTGPRVARVKIINNGEASVRLDSMSLRLFAGKDPVIDEYILNPVDFFPGMEVLAGGVTDSFQVMITDNPSNQMTVGTVVVEATLYGTDLNSLEELVATTEYGGKGIFLVQTPAVPFISGIIPSVSEATILQTRDWTLDLVVKNSGQSDFDLDLDPAKTFLLFSTSGDFNVVYPSQLNGGGTVLEGGAADTLRYLIDQTGSIQGVCQIDAALSGMEINSLTLLGPILNGPAISETVEIQTPGQLDIESITPTQDPVTVEQENPWSIDCSIHNSGGASVTLDLADFDSTGVIIPGSTGFIFEYPDQLTGGRLKLVGGATGMLRYTVANTGDISAGRRLLAGSIVGTEDNSGQRIYDYTESTGDSVTFQNRPVPIYAVSSLFPVTVSSGTGMTLEMTVNSEDPDHSTLILDRSSTYAWIGDTDGDTLRTWLSSISSDQLTGAASTVLRFNAATVDTSLARQSYIVGLHIEGEENGNYYSTVLNSAPDMLTIEEAPQLSIISIESPQSVTRALQPLWEVRMILHNTGEASVEIDPANTEITFEIAGKGDRTGEYTIVPPAALQSAGNLILAGNQVDTLVFDIEVTGNTTGTALINGLVTATDINSSETISDDTYTGGGTYILIQDPALPVIVESVASRETVTSGQTTEWFLTVHVQNQGEAAFTLDPDSTYIYSDYALDVPAGPVEFSEGGSVLPGGGSGHLVFGITPTPAIPTGHDLIIEVNLGTVENNRDAYLYYNTEEMSSGGSSVRIQSQPELHIVSLVNQSQRAPWVNHGQQYSISVEITNTGEAKAEEINLVLTSDGSSVADDSPVTIGSLDGFDSTIDTFHVTAAPLSDTEIFSAAFQSAVDANSRQDDLVIYSAAEDDQETVNIQLPGDISIISLSPSQDDVNAGQTVDWSVKVILANIGEGPVKLKNPSATDLQFRLDSDLLDDYLVIPPGQFASGAVDMVMDGGETDSLVYIISSTGIDTGSVEISSIVEYTDENDLEIPAVTRIATEMFHVKEPSGLRIISITSDAPNNSMFPNTSIVNIDQSFQITVVVENTGGDDLREVEVSLQSNGPAVTGIIQEASELATASQGEFIFSVTSPAAGVEIITAAITRAVSVNTGKEIPPIQAIESIENIQVQVAAELYIDTYISSPVGAEDDTLSTDQVFMVTSSVSNLGEAAIDASGQITLTLPPGYVLVYAETDSITRSFHAEEEIHWTLQAPSEASQDVAVLSCLISRVPRDINLQLYAGIDRGEAELDLVTEDAANISGCAMQIISPLGAIDATVSTLQDFTISSRMTPSLNTGDAWVELSVPAGCEIDGNNRIDLGDCDGSEKNIQWIISTSETWGSGFEFGLSSGGIDLNSQEEFEGCAGQLNMTIVERTDIGLEAFISGPPEALEGNMSVNLPFTVEANVTNRGTADLDTLGARLEIVLPSGSDYRLDGGSETFKKSFYPGQPVEWHLRAPMSATSPRNIIIRFDHPGSDENSGETVVPFIPEVSIPVTTEAGTVSMLNISGVDTIPPFVVPQGARDVPVLNILCRNNSAYTIGLDTLYVSVKDRKGDLRDPVSDAVTSISVIAGETPYTRIPDSTNPVPVIIGHDFTIEPGNEDTLLVSLDIARNAPVGQLRIDIARSDDVIFSIGEIDPIPIHVVWGGGSGSEDIGGHFECGPLTVMDADFSEYVHNYPNPFRAGSETTRITYYLVNDSNVSIKIFDLMGILVWKKDISAGDPGGTGSEGGTLWEEEWDGRNGRGELVRNGVYICKIQAGSESAIFKIAVAK
ncbi:MAG: hypothetical protein JW814_12085 [Candidatus Krumholzibacteriota bacterium]|nr:hypothetical protein [Candidatus Krumholzibacteriota bacterium]